MERLLKVCDGCSRQQVVKLALASEYCIGVQNQCGQGPNLHSLASFLT